MSDVEPALTKIKFCGLTDPGDADLAVEARAWAIGMILWPGSPRRCSLDVATEIAAAHRRKVELVGVFVNPTLDEVAQAADAAGFTMLQLHGDEGPAFCAEAARRTGCRVIKAARVRSGADIQALGPFHTDLHLLDSYRPGVPGGTGEAFAWDLARTHGSGVPVILFGTGTGQVKFYYDGGQVDATVDSGTGQTQFSLESLSQFIVLGSGKGWDMNVDWVRVWQ